tara:strand:+ start:2731 stop:3261 length:531 start_codon:yes stop_codon:yes gene_type:complete
MTELNIEHILLFFITAFLIYHLKCSCGDGFNVGIETNVPLCTNTHDPENTDITDWKPGSESNGYIYMDCFCPNGMMQVQDTSLDPKTNKKKNLYRCQDKKTVTQNCENFFKKCMCEEKKHIGNFISRYNTCIKKTPEGAGGCGAGWAECDWGDGTWRHPEDPRRRDDTKCKKKYGC